MSPLSHPVLRFACALALVGVAPAHATFSGDKGNDRTTRGADCGPNLRVVSEGQPADHSVPEKPESITHARTVTAPGLDRQTARHAHVRPGQTILKPHLNIRWGELPGLRVNAPAQFGPGVWPDMVRILLGATGGQLKALGTELMLRQLIDLGSYVTLRARLRAEETTRPLGSLTLGHLHYALELRSRIEPPRSRNQDGRLADVRTYGARRDHVGRQGGPDFDDPIPGGLTNRGFVRARLVGTVNGRGEVGPVLEPIDRDLLLLTGTWHYERDWLTLRLGFPFQKLARLQESTR